MVGRKQCQMRTELSYICITTYYYYYYYYYYTTSHSSYSLSQVARDE